MLSITALTTYARKTGYVYGAGAATGGAGGGTPPCPCCLSPSEGSAFTCLGPSSACSLTDPPNTLL